MQKCEWELVFDNGQRIVKEIEFIAGRDKIPLFVSGSFADIVTTLALLPALSRSQGNVSIIVVMSTRWRLLAARYTFPFVSYVEINDQVDAILREELARLSRPHVLRPGVLFPTLPTLHPLIAEAVLSGRITDLECRRLLFRLPIGEHLATPSLSAERSAEIEEQFAVTGCRSGKTVVISYSSNTNKMMPKGHQKLLINYCRSLGLDVLINLAKTFDKWELSDPYSDEEVRHIDLPCDAAIELVEKAGHYIGGSHGLTVLLSIFGANLRFFGQSIDATTYDSCCDPNALRFSPLMVSHVLGKDARIKPTLVRYDDNRVFYEDIAFI